jgi:hypothetical protein
VIDRLRERLDRPIADGERRRLFALVAAIVLVAGLTLARPPHLRGFVTRHITIDVRST